MKPVDIFKLLVRAVGVYLLYQIVIILPDYLIALNNSNALPSQVFVKLAGLIVAAVWFLFGAPPILKLAYPKARIDAPTTERELAKEVEPTFDGPACVSCGKPTPQDSTICPACGWTQPR